MRSRTMFMLLSVVMLALAGCGSSNKKTTSTLLPGSKPGEAPIPSVTYQATLGPNGAGARAAKSSGHAVIIIKGDNHTLCWAFTEFTNFTPTARTKAALKGDLKVGIISSPLGKEKWAPTGCGVRSPILLRLLEANAHKLQVQVETPPHFERGVAGPLDAAR